MLNLYTFKMRHVYSYSTLFDKYLTQEVPELQAYFQKHCLNTMTFSIDWFYTLYSRAFDINITRVIWDMFLVFGPEFLLRCGVAMMVTLKDEMMTGYMNEGFNFVRVRTGKLKISKILKSAFKYKLSSKAFLAAVEEQFNQQPKPKKKIATVTVTPVTGSAIQTSN